MDFRSTNTNEWRESLSSYGARIESLSKPDLIPLDSFYRTQLPTLIKNRNSNPYITKSELKQLMQWKLSRGKWRPRLFDFVASLDEKLVESASRKAFEAMPNLSKAISELTVLKGVGPATASAILAAYAPDTAPFMSDEAMLAALGNSKEYTLKQYLLFAEKLQEKSKELNLQGETFTASDVERALWSSAIGSTYKSFPSEEPKKKAKRKRKS